jgi:hypothetical protein
MKVFTQYHTLYTNFLPMDDKAREWLKANHPVESSNGNRNWFGDTLVVMEPEVEKLRNKFVDAGGQVV